MHVIDIDNLSSTTIGPHVACTDPGHINQSTIGPPVVCHRINGSIIAKPDPNPVDISIAMSAVGQQCWLEARSGPDQSVMWVHAHL